MSKVEFYEAMKKKLREKDLTPEEYERLVQRLERYLFGWEERDGDA